MLVNTFMYNARKGSRGTFFLTVEFVLDVSMCH